jgi:hypothetical protein
MSAPGDCTCDSECPGEDGCACIYSYDDEQCDCDCPGTIIIHPTPTVLSRDARVAFNAKDCELAKLGEFLAKRSSAEVLIPASRARVKLSLQMQDTTFAEVLEAAGLVVQAGGQTESGGY